ncbi:MAG: transglutaminase-like domain-containing protein [Lachnospiraceae bacterium]|nr:transglutaminase-like domain-containing protein [Lachnospiraceae bacterium]
MPDINETIRKTIELTEPQSLVRIDSFINAMEDLNPEISDDISFLRKICRNYSDEIGKLLYSAYENRTKGSKQYYDRLGEFLINECGYNENWKNRFMECFSYLFAGSVKAVKTSESGHTSEKIKGDLKKDEKAPAGKTASVSKKQPSSQTDDRHERMKQRYEKAMVSLSEGNRHEAVYLLQSINDRSEIEAIAQYCLGEIFRGEDRQEALIHYNKAAAAGHKGAERRIKTGIKGDFFDSCLGRFAFNRLKTAQNGNNLITYYNVVMRTLKKYYSGEDDIGIEINSNGRKYWYKDFFDCKRYSVSYEEAKKATIAAFNDCPLAYFAYTYDVFGNPESKLSLVAVDDAFRLGSIRKRYSKLIENEILRIAGSLPADADDEGTAQYVYDKICEKSVYDTEKGNCGYVDVYAHSIASFAEKHMAVCEGFAKTFQAIMLYLGYECLSVSGYVGKDSESDPNRHAWNLLKMGEKWRLVDITSGLSGYKDVFCKNPEVYKEFRDKDRVFDCYKYEFKHPKAE